jgi:hypothetical protein
MRSEEAPIKTRRLSTSFLLDIDWADMHIFVESKFTERDESQMQSKWEMFPL